MTDASSDSAVFTYHGFSLPRSFHSRFPLLVVLCLSTDIYSASSAAEINSHQPIIQYTRTSACHASKCPDRLIM